MDLKVEISNANTKQQIHDLASRYGYTLQATNKTAMKKELLETLYPNFKCEIKRVTVILTEHDRQNGKIIYKGDDNLFYDCNGNKINYKND